MSSYDPSDARGDAPQNPYGQNPYGQDPRSSAPGQGAADNPYAQPGYSAQSGYAARPGQLAQPGYAAQPGQSPQFGQPGAYPQQGYGAPGYPANSGGYNYAYVAAPGPRPAGPPQLGWAGLWMAISAVVVSSVAHFIVLAALSTVPTSSGSGSYEGLDAFVIGGTWYAIVQGVCTLLGIAALVVSIVATAQNRGRTMAIVGICISAAGPLISYLFAALAAATSFASSAGRSGMDAMGYLPF